MVVLLANLDAGWLQNPVFCSAANDTAMVRWRPSHFPCQLLFSGAFADRVSGFAAMLSAAWLALLGAVLLVSSYLRTRGVRRVG